MTKSMTNPKLLKVEIHFDDNNWLRKCQIVLFSYVRLLKLLTIMCQSLSESLLRVEIGAKIKVSSFLFSL